MKTPADASGRHDIALFPFLSLACLLEWVPYVRRSRNSVAMLLEWPLTISQVVGAVGKYWLLLF